MSRDLTTNLITEITSAAFRPFYADEATTPLALGTGIGELSNQASHTLVSARF